MSNNMENMEDIDASTDLEMGSPTYETPSSLHPACWPASPGPNSLLPFRADMSSLRYIAPSQFPSLRPSPTGLPLRLEFQLPALQALDSKNQPIPNVAGNADGSGIQASVGHLAVGNPHGNPHGNLSNQDSTRTEEAIRQLEKHIKQRGPYVSLASSRLQAAMRLRNSAPFSLQHALNACREPAPKNTIPTSASLDTGHGSGADTLLNNRVKMGFRSADGKFVKMPLKMGTVNGETGEGLLAFLLTKAREAGQTKRECKSISIHDFTPDVKTGAHQNVLLGYYDDERMGKVESYEVDLPTVTINEETGEETQGSETWLWILIRRRVLSTDMSDKSTAVVSAQGTRDPAAPAPTTSILYMPTQRTSNPPNFPCVLPDSWVVFAAPLAHVTVHPQSFEKMPLSADAIKWSGGRDLMAHKRADYDFSHDGVPLFEFSNIDFFVGQRTDFLSVEKMGGFDPSDEYLPYSDDEYHVLYEAWVADGFSERDAFGSKPCPNRGVWWTQFYSRVWEDCEMWQKVKEAMGRGKCRIVLRWDEYKGYDDRSGGDEGQLCSWDMRAERDWVMMDEARNAGQYGEIIPAADITRWMVERDLGRLLRAKKKVKSGKKA